MHDKDARFETLNTAANATGCIGFTCTHFYTQDRRTYRECCIAGFTTRSFRFFLVFNTIQPKLMLTVTILNAYLFTISESCSKALVWNNYPIYTAVSASTRNGDFDDVAFANLLQSSRCWRPGHCKYSHP